MRSVALPGTDLETSRLAFGSSALMARLGRRESLRLLEVAHDSGITHIDTARSYGYGEAESAVGEFLSRHRDGVTVATKLGMVPPRPSRALRTAKSLARYAVRRVPALRPLVRRPAQSLGGSGCFEPDEARTSLETSLRELGVETIDILLLHECRPRDLETEGLLAFLEDVVREGKVRYFGVGTDPDSTRTIVESRPEFARVVQVADDAVDAILERLPISAGTAVVTHSAVRRQLPTLTALMADEERRRGWSEALGLDCGRVETLGTLLLSYALQSNPNGPVLFSSASEDRIRANARLVERPVVSAEQVAVFTRLAREATADGSRVA